jgi:hypothetical protein
MTNFQDLLHFDIANSDMLYALVLKIPRIQPTKGDGGWEPTIYKKRKVRYNMFESCQEAATEILALPRVGRWLREWRDSAPEGDVAEKMNQCVRVLSSNACWGKWRLHSYEVNVTGIILFRLLCEERPNRVWRMAIRRLIFHGALYNPVMELRIDGIYACSELLESEADHPEMLFEDVKLAEALACYSHDPENNELLVVGAIKKLERMLPMVAAWTEARPWMTMDTDFIKTLAYLSELEEDAVREALFTMGWF